QRAWGPPVRGGASHRAIRQTGRFSVTTQAPPSDAATTSLTTVPPEGMPQCCHSRPSKLSRSFDVASQILSFDRVTWKTPALPGIGRSCSANIAENRPSGFTSNRYEEELSHPRSPFCPAMVVRYHFTWLMPNSRQPDSSLRHKPPSSN